MTTENRASRGVFAVTCIVPLILGRTVGILVLEWVDGVGGPGGVGIDAVTRGLVHEVRAVEIRWGSRQRWRRAASVRIGWTGHQAGTETAHLGHQEGEGISSRNSSGRHSTRPTQTIAYNMIDVANTVICDSGGRGGHSLLKQSASDRSTMAMQQPDLFACIFPGDHGV